MTHDHYQPMIHGHWEDDMKQGLTMFYSYRLSFASDAAMVFSGLDELLQAVPT